MSSLLTAGLARAHLETLFRSRAAHIPVAEIDDLLHNTLPDLEGGGAGHFFHNASAAPALTPGTYTWEDVNGQRFTIQIAADGRIAAFAVS